MLFFHLWLRYLSRPVSLPENVVPLKKLSASETGLDRFCFSYFQIVFIGLVNKKKNFLVLINDENEVQ